MTFETLRSLACEFFSVSEDVFVSKDRGDEAVSLARHSFRAMMYDKFGRAKSAIAKFEGRSHATIINSCTVILKNKQFEKEYDAFVNHVMGKQAKHVEVVRDNRGLERITNDAFDERFYKHPTKINDRTGLPYFPAFHFITSEGEPTPFGLQEWYKQMGYKADEILERSKIIGSYVHESIDRMIKNEAIISQSVIDDAFPSAKEAHRVKECLLGFMNFMRDEEPVVLASERMEVGDDFGFTIDNIFRIKSDKYKNKWASDWKTSRSATDGHKMQIEAIRRVTGCDRGMIVVVGNSTAKKYTITKVPETKHDYLWDKFLAIKETAYVELLERGAIKPREDNMPMEFSLKDINVKFKL